MIDIAKIADAARRQSGLDKPIGARARVDEDAQLRLEAMRLAMNAASLDRGLRVETALQEARQIARFLIEGL